MKRKNIISLAIAFAFLALSITGILLYIKQKGHAVEITHTIFGLIFVGFAVFHILNNWISIKSYSKERSTGKFQKEFVIAASLFGLVLIGGVTEILEPVAEAGKIFAGKRQERSRGLSFEETKTNEKIEGNTVRVLVEKQKSEGVSAVAIWAESIDGAVKQMIFAPAKVLELPAGTKDVGEAIREGEAKELPFSNTIFKEINSDKFAKSNFENATPLESFVVSSKINLPQPYVIKLQVVEGNKSELYQTKIENNADVARLKGSEGKMIKSAVVIF